MDAEASKLLILHAFRKADKKSKYIQSMLRCFEQSNNSFVVVNIMGMGSVEIVESVKTHCPTHCMLICHCSGELSIYTGNVSPRPNLQSDEALSFDGHGFGGGLIDKFFEQVCC